MARYDYFVVNPKTKKYIRVGGGTYNRLVRDGVSFKRQKPVWRALASKSYTAKVKPKPGVQKKRQSLQRAKSVTVSKKEFAKFRAWVKKNRPSQLADIDRMHKSKRKSATRFWRALAPKRGKERTRMKANCGDVCFLIPEKKKFPVCSFYDLETKGQCRLDRSGVASAKVRARQWKYPEVEKLAAKLEQDFYKPL
ncbi:unnamed protein product [marine sediment metagenome]|uniref:Uncharacterized protein n=1 Tax=marine sediment metagenome TaxID=412755 RepID=X1TP98_9ZZZZ